MSGPSRRHFLVIGAQRCGTTYLHDQLAAHPQVAMAEPARPEPKVFLSAEVAERGAGWYRRTWFAHAAADAVLGEKSTSYLESATAPGRVRAVLDDVRIVVQLRDPVARAVSNWRFSTRHGLERRPLAAALEQNLRGPLAWDPERTSVSPYAYLERGRYAEQLGPWLAAFPDRVRVQFLEHQVADPDRIADLYGWLGVDPAFRPPGLGRPVNESTPAPGTAPTDDRLDADLLARLRAHFDEPDTALARLLGAPPPWRAAAPTEDSTR